MRNGKNPKNIGLTAGMVITSVLASLFIIGTVLTPNTLKKVNGLNNSIPLPEDLKVVKPPEKGPNYQAINIAAQSAILIDQDTFYPMYEKNADKTYPMASTTKMMTAMVILEDYRDHLEDTATITPQMINVNGSKIGLKVGEKIKVSELLKGMLIPSGNDAAYSLALNFGSKEEFAAKMNQKAAALGLASTIYKDPAGLDDTAYSTAHDLAVLGAYAIGNNTFKKIVSTPSAQISSVDGGLIHDLKNSNRMLQSDDPYFYQYTSGIKTGFTYEAGHCLVSLAAQNGHSLIGVVLNTNENTIFASAKESRRLLDWGFTNWVWH